METYAEDFTVAELLVSQLDGFAGAAELHLGEAMPDGRKPARPNGHEAGAALIALAALLHQFLPVMTADALVPFRARLAALNARFAQSYPEIVLVLPGGDTSAARGAFEPPSAPRGATSASSPLPGLGLPSKRSGSLLFPNDTSPVPRAPTAPPVPAAGSPLEFSVADLIIGALEGYASAALLHLGEALPDGARLRSPDPDEAWRAILGGTALLNAFALMMDEAVLIPYELGYRQIIEHFVRLHPTHTPHLPAWAAEALEAQSGPVASLEQVVRESFEALRRAP
ncbi:MAG TPA: hypothetical protein V6D47_22530 [Oscillatoriaceae cyanobacterium]